MTRRTTLRPAITLTEVLVALFVMAVGMIALLTLFPLGAMQIGQAIKDQRTADATKVADSLMRSHYHRYVVEPLQSGLLTEVDLVNPASAYSVSYMTAMEQPNAGLALTSQRTNSVGPLSDPTSFATPASLLTFPSYPVFVDPNGFLFRSTTSPFLNSSNWVAGVHSLNSSPLAVADTVALPRIPRRTLSFPQQLTAPTASQIAFLGQNWQYRYTTLQDDLDFGEDGIANQSGTGVAKAGRYNWSWVLQRPTQGNRQITNMTVVVYDQRAFNYARAEDEIAYPAAFTVGSTNISFAYDTGASPPLDPPSIRAGQWIMDGTINNASGIRNAFFYRVTAVTDTPGATAGTGTVTLDLQTPIRQPWGTTVASFSGQVYILRGVAEVFERQPLSASDNPILP